MHASKQETTPPTCTNMRETRETHQAGVKNHLNARIK